MAFTKEAEAALDVLMKGYTGPGFLSGPDGLLKQLSKALIERAMEAELSQELGYGKGESGEKGTSNRRNGRTKKTLRTDQGPMEIEVPRDRSGDFSPQIVPKHSREWRGFDEWMKPKQA